MGLRFQVLFHSPPGVLFTFPSRYYALSVAISYLALEGGPPRFRQDFSCPVLLRFPTHAVSSVSPTGLSPSLAYLPSVLPLQSLISYCTHDCVLMPVRPYNHHAATVHTLARRGFRLFPLRSPLLRESHVDFSSSRYLDGSVPWVFLPQAMYSPTGDQ